jgi:hypothetical protein
LSVQKSSAFNDLSAELLQDVYKIRSDHKLAEFVFKILTIRMVYLNINWLSQIKAENAHD